MTDNPMPTSPPVVRFAPSPNGYLHIGHAYSALLNFRFARQTGGRSLLRIEDIDTGRARAEFEEAIFEDLAWLGLEWETPVRRQSQHFDDYAAALARIDDQRLLYPCFCTRGDIRRATDGKGDWPLDPDGSPIYPGTCRNLPAKERAAKIASGEVFALRLDMQAALQTCHTHLPLAWQEYLEGDLPRSHAATPEDWGDVVLRRKDIPASYHIAVVVDDALQGVTHVIRGMDLHAATSVHRLLQTLLGLPAPAYRHHPLIRDGDGEKLSKSLKSETLRALREKGVSPRELIARLGLQSTCPAGK